VHSHSVGPGICEVRTRAAPHGPQPTPATGESIQSRQQEFAFRSAKIQGAADKYASFRA